MAVLVTGAKGFIGRHLVTELQNRHVPGIVALDLKEGRDCLDYFRTVKAPFDLVFHCAATVGGREGIDLNAARVGANNLHLDAAMFEYALETRPGRVVYFSSAAAYPVWLQRQPVRLREVDAAPGHDGMPDETYGWAKLTGELIADRVRKAGVPVTVVRPFSSYDYDQDDCYPFPTFVQRAARGDSPFDVWGDGTQTRDFIHVDDLIQAILVLVENDVDGPVNLGTGVSTSVDQLARIAMAAAGYDAPIRHLGDKPEGVRHRVSNNELLRRYYTPQITVEEGMARALDNLATRV